MKRDYTQEDIEARERRIGNEEKRRAQEKLIHSILQSPIALARLRDPIKRK